MTSATRPGPAATGPTPTGRRPRVVVLDYGSGNLRSACRAIEYAGAEVELTADPRRAVSADGLVVPGVGAFAPCVEGVRAVGGDEVVAERLAAGRPVLGICVGFQVLFDRGIEHGTTAPGLGVLPGVVERLPAERLPHMGWNTVSASTGSRLFAGLAEERFYFVHSYGVALGADPGLWPAGATGCELEGQLFCAAVEQGPLSATQFHPEKSGRAGGRLLSHWVADLR